MGNMGQFGDTTLTKVFVGGLAWETQREVLRDHFARYGEILEAVIISDKLTGRSKGYGFVTFREAEAARKACEDPTPLVNGRRANCNLASLGVARRGKGSPTAAATPPPHHPPPGLTAIPVSRAVTTPPLPAQWIYPPPRGAPHPAAPFQHPPPFHGVPFYAAYGYSPSYVADVGYNAKLSPSGGGHYMQGGHFPPHSAYTTQGGMLHPNMMLPFYPYYHYHHHPQSMGMPAHFYAPPAIAPVPAIPTIVSKPIALPPPTVHIAVEQVTC